MSRRKRKRPTSTLGDGKRAADARQIALRPRQPWLSIGVVLGLLLLYAGTYHFPPLFDDKIINPPQLEQFLWRWQTLEPRWVSYGSFGLNYLASGLQVFSYRIVNVLLHAASVLACFALVRELLHDNNADAGARMRAEWSALGASALFGVHPVAVYAVGYLAQRSTVMATLFGLLALVALARGLRLRRTELLWLATAFYFLSVYSKEHAVMVPAVAAIVALRIRTLDLGLARELAAPLATMGAIAIVVTLRMRFVIGTTYEPYTAEVIGQLGDAAPAAGLDSHHALSALTQSALFFKYLLLWIVPWPGWISGDIRVPLATPSSALPYAIGAAAYLLWGAAGCLLLWRGGRNRILGLAMLMPWLLFLTEFASIRAQEAFVLYRSYLWMIGLPIALGAVLARLPPRIAIGLVLGLALICVGLTRDRLHSLSSPLAFWDDVVQKNPDRSLPFVDRGFSNRGVARLQAGALEGALSDLNESIRLNPINGHAWINRAVVRARLGELAGALEDANKALELAPNLGEAYAERCVIHMRRQDDTAALSDCNEALRRVPNYPMALINRGGMLAKRGRLEEALVDFDGVLRYDENNAMALYNKGAVLRDLGRRAEARPVLDSSCRLGIARACELLRVL